MMSAKREGGAGELMSGMCGAPRLEGQRRDCFLDDTPASLKEEVESHTLQAGSRRHSTGSTDMNSVNCVCKYFLPGEHHVAK